MPQYTGTAGTSAPISVAYQEFGADVAINTTTEATAVAIVTAPTFTPNGSDNFWIEFYCGRIDLANVVGATMSFTLYDNGAVFGTANANLAQFVTAAIAAPFLSNVYVKTKIFLPTAVAHAYGVRAYESGGAGIVRAGTTFRNGWINISRDI